MKRITYLALAFLLASGLTFATPKPAKTFTGKISDAMCGLKHMMPGGDKACTVACVKEGSKYVLADEAHNKVYQLTDQAAAAKYPGESVKVTGTLKGDDTIAVSSIQPVK